MIDESAVPRMALPSAKPSYRRPRLLNDNEKVDMERTIEVPGISDELLARLDQRAHQIGVDRNSYLKKLIERAVGPPGAATSLAELLNPVHDFTEAHGISEEEIQRFFDQQLAASRRERPRADEGGRSK